MRAFTTLTVSLLIAMAAGCETAPQSESKKSMLRDDVQATIATFKAKDPSISKFFDTAAGFAVFPSIGKGAIGVGGAYGRGELYEGGQMVGYCDMSQGTIGLQLGGQAYREVIFFENANALDQFKRDDFAFSANARAVAAKAGASATADYEDGVLVFTMTKGGLMFEASIGGQKFTYESK